MEVAQLLKQRIPDDLIQMNNLGRDLDAVRYEAFRRMVDANKKLTEEKNRFQMIKTKSNTETDRKFYTEFHTRDAQYESDLATGEYRMVNDKVNFIQSLSKNETELYKRS